MNSLPFTRAQLVTAVCLAGGVAFAAALFCGGVFVSSVSAGFGVAAYEAVLQTDPEILQRIAERGGEALQAHARAERQTSLMVLLGSLGFGFVGLGMIAGAVEILRDTFRPAPK